MKRGLKWVRNLLLGLVGIILLVLLASIVVYPSDYIWRVLRWRDADVYDYQKFPERPFSHSTTPFFFAEAIDEARVQRLFAEAGVADIDELMTRNQTQAFLVIQDDKILYEKYYNGADRETIVTSFSIAKSFTSALVGIAIAEGHIDSVDDPMTDYLPELAAREAAFANITIRDLLLMSSGIRYVEMPFFSGDDAKTYYHPDLRGLALEETRLAALPGEAFVYNNYHPLLLGMILERATGMPVADYLAAKIWQPIGTEFDGSWSLDENGFEKMESGINGRSIDFAKFGRLFLHNGNWNGAQLVPMDWVEESTQPNLSVDRATYYDDSPFFREEGGYYQYMWWGQQREGMENDFMALGNHGQFIYLSPAKQLMIIRFGETYGEFGGARGWRQLFFQVATVIER